MCPYCQSTSRTFKKHGFFTRKSDSGIRRIRQFYVFLAERRFHVERRHRFAKSESPA